MDINFNITLNQNGTNCKYINKMGLFFGQNKVSTPVVTSNIKYGRLYNWFAIRDSLFAPVGWHVPTRAEFETLIAFLGGEAIAGGKLKETGLVYWDIPNTGASNEYLFYLKGSGDRDYSDGSFLDLLQYANIWTTTQELGQAFGLNINYSDITSFIYTSSFKLGYSCRLIKDDSILVPSLVDLDGNVYRTTKIGNQVWLADNWACTKLNDETPIPEVTDNTVWAALTTMARCNYNNDIANVFL
jgi:uncharacterized protein (TIGR02145 family)